MDFARQINKRTRKYERARKDPSDGQPDDLCRESSYKEKADGSERDSWRSLEEGAEPHRGKCSDQPEVDEPEARGH
jgi:hypothetical protein